MKLAAGPERSFVGILFVLTLSLGCSGTRAQRAAAAAEGGPEGESINGGFRVVGVLWYLRSHAAMDDLTLVYGGVTGSAALVHLDKPNKTSYWTFLDGKIVDGKEESEVFIRKTETSPNDTTTSKRGWHITSVLNGPWQPEKDGNRRNLSWALAELFELSKTPPTDPAKDGTEMDIRHAPFLTGKGWTQSKGATWAEVSELCQQLELTPAVKSPDKTGLVYKQNPMHGVPMPLGGNKIIEVWFDGNPVSIPRLGGDSFENPIPVTDPNGDGIAVVPVAITPAHGDDATSGISTRFRKDLFLRLPAAALDREVTITQVDATDRVVLTLFRMEAGQPRDIASGDSPHTGKAADQETLRFRPDTEDIVVMVEFETRNTGSTLLRIEW